MVKLWVLEQTFGRARRLFLLVLRSVWKGHKALHPVLTQEKLDL